MNYDTKLKSWFIIELQDQNNINVEKILCGIVEFDKKHRFKTGTYIFTSSIIKIIDEEYVHTRNSIYKIKKNNGDTIILPNTVFTNMALKSGFSPLQVKQFYSDEILH